MRLVCCDLPQNAEVVRIVSFVGVYAVVIAEIAFVSRLYSFASCSFG